MKKSRSWFSCSFFLPSFQTTCLAARTIVQAQQVRLAAGEGFRTIVHTQVWQPGESCSRSSPIQAAGLLLPNNCSRRTAAQPGRPRSRFCSQVNLLLFRTIVRSRSWWSPIPIRFRGDYLPETEQLSRLQPDYTPITPIPLRSEQFFGHRSHTLSE